MIPFLKNKSQYYTENIFFISRWCSVPKNFCYWLKNYSILLKKCYVYYPRNYEHLTQEIWGSLSIKNRKVNRRRHVLTEETLDEIGERNWTEITVSVWEQRQYADLLVGKPASQGCEQQPSLAAHSTWEALYYLIIGAIPLTVSHNYRYCRNSSSLFSTSTFSLIFLLSSNIRSEGSIAIVKIFDFDFFMIFHSTSLPESKNVF